MRISFTRESIGTMDSVAIRYNVTRSPISANNFRTKNPRRKAENAATKIVSVKKRNVCQQYETAVQVNARREDIMTVLKPPRGACKRNMDDGFRDTDVGESYRQSCGILPVCIQALARRQNTETCRISPTVLDFRLSSSLPVQVPFGSPKSMNASS